MEKLNKIIVSDTSYTSDDPYKLVYSNITVVNVLREEGIDVKYIHSDAMVSYYVDYYLAQYNNGNFSQFVWNTQWSNELNREIKDGLLKMGADKHLKLFTEQCEKIEKLKEGKLQTFLQSEYFGKNAIRNEINNDDFFDLEEDLATLNSAWLRNHRDLQVLPIEGMFAELEKFIGREIQR